METHDDRQPLGIKRRSLLAATLGAALLPIGAVASACEGSRNQGGTDTAGDKNSERARKLILDFHGGRIQSPQLFNPFVTGFVINAGFHQALSEPLFILNYQTGDLDPWLGESFTSNDALDHWRLKIKDGILWSDGEAYDADDIVFTMGLLMKHADLSWAAGITQWVKKVTKIDALTIDFELKNPNPRFVLDNFCVKIHSSLTIVPQHIWQDKDPLKFTNYDKTKGWPIFTGPYTLVSSTATLVRYQRRDDWWGVKAGFKELPKPEALEWVVNETEDIRVAKAAEHGLDSVADLTAGAFDTLKARNPDTISWLPEKPYAWSDPCTRLLSLNTAMPPWNDRDMRWALNQVIDKEQVAAIAYEGTTTPAPFFFPNYPSMTKWTDLLKQEGVYDKYPLLTHDPDKAAATFQAKGYVKDHDGYWAKDGKQLTLRIDAPTDFIEIWRYADVVTEQLQKAGIRATSRKLAIGTWGDNIAMGRFEAAADWSACGSVTEPWTSMGLFTADKVVPIGKRAGSNSQRWSNATFTHLVNQMAGLPVDDEKLKPLFVQAANEWLKDLPFIPLTYARKLYAFDNHYWKGWATEANDYLQPTLDWGNAHVIIHRLTQA
jgi:peptide/nickel transport system substrate-binding protein